MQANEDKRFCWKPPKAGWIKINIDGAVDLLNNVAGTRLIRLMARDHKGKFRATRLRKYNNIQDSFTIELLGCWDAIVFAREHVAGLPKGYTKYEVVHTLWQHR
jgi:hypothetical protein